MKKIILINLVVLLSTAYGRGPIPQVRVVPFPYSTIQEAIDASNDGDTVVVHPGTYTGEGNRDIDFLGKAITVRSEDPDEEGIVAATIIDCQGTGEDPHRAFILQSEEDANSIIDGFTIINGYIRIDGLAAGEGETEGGPGQDSYGGAINCTNSSPTIRNCIIRNCIAEGGKGGNGTPGTPGEPGDPNDPNDPGIPPTEGGPGGSAGSGYGGAIYCDPYSGPTILNCRISNCSALGGEGGEGGEGGTGGEPNDPNAPDGTSGSSDTSGYGGGIYIAAGSIATVTDCYFTDCNAVAGAGDGESRGGALYYGTGYSGAFTGNANDCEAGYGAGIYCDANCTFALAGNTFAGGIGMYGTGVYFDANCVLTMDNCLVTDGTGDFGTGIYFGADCNATLSNVDILNHTATADGAGLYCGSNGVLTLNNCNVMQSEAMGSGGAIYCDSNGILTLNKCNVEESTAAGKGGAIYCDSNSVLDFQDCNITQSTAGGDGGGIYYAGGPAMSLSNCGLSDNHSLYGYGGCIYGGDPFAYVADTNVVIINCAIGNNSAQYGGALCLSGTNSVLTDSDLRNNTAEYGGGAFWYRSKISINNCAISGNSAEGLTYCSGGGLYCLDSSLSIRNSDMVGNSAIGFGGAAFIIGPNLLGGSQELKNCLITGNTAGLDGAGLSCNVDAALKMTNCTVAGNQVLDFDGSGGGISCYAASVEIINSILWNNAAQYGAQIAIGDPLEPNNPPATVMLTYSDVQGGEEYVFVSPGCMLDWGEGNIELNPLFAEGYHLNQIEAGSMVNSPCVDAGSESAEALELQKYTTRIDGVPDINIVDIGYHYRMQRVPCDCDLDGDVDMLDLVVVFSYWLEEECDELDDCQGADSNLDTDVNFIDYAICAQAYTPPDKTPPEPDPSTWADEPHAIKDPRDPNSNWISMTATTAYDESGVEYLFECTDQDGVVLHSSGWQNSPTYVDTGLSGDTIYTYKVRSRDKSPSKNEGAWSVEASAFIDRSPPEPNPSQWKTPPFEYYNEQTYFYYHGMEAEAASDPGGVEYYFFCAGGGPSSGWQDSPQYSVRVPGPYMPYSYKVMTRDKLQPPNEGAWSESLTVE